MTYVSNLESTEEYANALVEALDNEGLDAIMENDDTPFGGLITLTVSERKPFPISNAFPGKIVVCVNALIDHDYSIEEALSTIAQDYDERQGSFEDEYYESLSKIMDWEFVKDRLIIKLTNASYAESNGGLDGTIYRFMDDTDGQIITEYAVNLCDTRRILQRPINEIRVNAEMLKAWDKTVDEVHEAALKSMPEILPHKIQGVNEFLASAGSLDGLMLMIAQSEEYMYKLSTANLNSGVGASVILYPDMVKDIYERFGDSYLIPASTQEWLICPVNKLPKEYKEAPEKLREMVTKINDGDFVKKGEILDYGVYGVFNGRFVRFPYGNVTVM